MVSAQQSRFYREIRNGRCVVNVRGTHNFERLFSVGTKLVHIFADTINVHRYIADARVLFYVSCLPICLRVYLQTILPNILSSFLPILFLAHLTAYLYQSTSTSHHFTFLSTSLPLLLLVYLPSFLPTFRPSCVPSCVLCVWPQGNN